jgi:isoquinoline 1-oxidoreductase alpha subunit
MIVAGAGLLKKNPNPSAEEIVKQMQGNICRCGTYPRIVDAIQRAARRGSHA